MGKEHCAICGTELSFLNKFKADKSFGPEVEGKIVCGSCQKGHVKEQVSEAVQAKSLFYDGEHVKAVQLPPGFSKDAFKLVDDLSARGFRIKGIVEQEMQHASLVVMEKDG